MRRWLALPLVVAAAGLLLDPPPAGAQGVKPVEESFNTADGVRLKGLFHKSPNGAKQGNAVVVLLYPPGPEKDMLKGDWDGLVGRLNEAGFHVFRFDWRGHGKSTDIVDPLGDNTPYNGFWVNQITGAWNQKFIRGANKKPAKNDIRVKADVTGPGYFPVYVTDLAAARFHLDLKNDQGEVNTRSIYLVGAGDAATLGMMWLAAEWQRPAVAPTLLNGLQYKVVPQRNVLVQGDTAGDDVAGAIWLSASRPAAVPEATVQAWPRAAVKLRDINKMLFLYGADDKEAKAQSEAFYNKVLVAKGNKALGLSEIDQTHIRHVEKTKLNGVALLGKDDVTKAESTVLDYLAARQKDRVSYVPKTRNYSTPYYVDVNYFLSLR